MSERNEYPPGVPCWVDTLQADPQEAVRFYRGLFGWEFAGPGPMPGDPPGQYFVARLRGRDVAGVGTQPPPGRAAVWNTHVCVASVEETSRNAKTAGGTIVVPPFDALPAGRLAVLADPGGAMFCAWEARERVGARVVNEPAAWAMSALNTRNTEGAAAFYGAVFGWEAHTVDLGDLQVTLLRLPGYAGGEPKQPVPRDVVGVMLEMNDAQFPSDAQAHWSVDFWIDDADTAAKRAGDLGGKVIAPPYDIAGFRRSHIADPEGAVFTVSQLTAIS